MDALLRRRAMIAAGGSPTPPPTPTPVFYDYLVFDGTASIEITGLSIPDDFTIGVYLGHETNKAAQRLFWLPGSPVSFGAILNSSTNSSNRCFSIYYGASGAASTNKTLAFSTKGYSFFLTPKRFGWNSTSYTFTKGTASPTGTLMIGKNATTGNPYSGDMMRFRIYGSDAQNVTDATDLLNNYTPIYTFKPCTYNGEAGMWCVETSTFHGNTAGEGTLSVRNSE